MTSKIKSEKKEHFLHLLVSRKVHKTTYTCKTLNMLSTSVFSKLGGPFRKALYTFSALLSEFHDLSQCRHKNWVHSICKRRLRKTIWILYYYYYYYYCYKFSNNFCCILLLLVWRYFVSLMNSERDIWTEKRLKM